MLKRITRKLAILAVLAGMLSGLAPSMLAVRTAHADQSDTSTTQADMVKDDVPQPATKNADTDGPMPLTDSGVTVRTPAVPDDAIASGTAGSCLFYITSDLQMVITPADGAHGVLPNLYVNKDWPWYRYAAYIRTIRFDKGVKTGDSLNWAFSNGSTNAYSQLESVDFTNLDAADLTQMWGILAYDRTLTEVNMNMLNAVQVTSMGEAFRSTDITGLNLTAIGDGKLWSIDDMCNACKRLESVMTGWTLPVLYFAQGTFKEDDRLASIDAEDWRFGQAGSLSLMFNGCSGLKTLDVSRWNVGSVSNLYYTFGGCAGLKTLDVSTWDTGSLTDARGLFHRCTGLKTLDVSGWNTGKATSFENMFYHCTSLTKLDVSGWDTGKATGMNGMFSQDGKLTVLDVSRWDTSNVRDMSGMFSGAGISALDVSRWNMSHVGNVDDMFNNCANLVTLDTSRWRLDSA